VWSGSLLELLADHGPCRVGLAVIEDFGRVTFGQAGENLQLRASTDQLYSTWVSVPVSSGPL